jgi:hypothetical protein
VHGLALTGHPAKGDDIGPLRYFHIPGQDLVWRWVLPDTPSALEGVESTQAKCASSAMLHARRRRNANECCGAYGHALTWAELNWLARWAFVRGVNLLFPHAFYYSIRGPRLDERPPDVGPNSAWWDRFPEYALECRRLSWINTASKPICRLAILGQADFLPWQSAKICFCHQYDFNYVEERDLLENAVIDAKGIHLAGMVYRALILEHRPSVDVLTVLVPLAQAGGIFHFTGEDQAKKLLEWLDGRVPKNLRVSPDSPALRVRCVVKDRLRCLMVFNEEQAPMDIALEFPGQSQWFKYDAIRDQLAPLAEHRLHLDGYELKVLICLENSD